MESRRIVITGMGVVSPVGSTLEAFWDSLLNGRSGIGPATRHDLDGINSKIAGEVRDFDPLDVMDKKEARKTDRFVHYALGASNSAVLDSGLDLEREDRDRIGVLVGTGTGGIGVIEDAARTLLSKGAARISPFCVPQMISNIAAGYVAIEYGLRGANFGIASACASGAHCIGESLRIIQHGEADIMVAGGTEAPLTALGVGGFAAMRALSRRNDDPEGASRPFDAGRDGFVIAEGAGMLILEELEHARARGARIYCEVTGYGRTCDAYHITAPDSTGSGGAKCMELAMADANINAGDVDYINAHGTSTSLNDKCETLAIKSSMGEDVARSVAISSTKSMTGHLLGAAGAIEAVACALTIRDNAVPPTINYTTPDHECDLDYTPNTAREMRVDACLSNSLGFGGHNVSLCFSAA